MLQPSESVQQSIIKNVPGIHESRLWGILNRLGWVQIPVCVSWKQTSWLLLKWGFDNVNDKTQSILSWQTSCRHHKRKRTKVQECVSAAASHKVCHCPPTPREKTSEWFLVEDKDPVAQLAPALQQLFDGDETDLNASGWHESEEYCSNRKLY